MKKGRDSRTISQVARRASFSCSPSIASARSAMTEQMRPSEQEATALVVWGAVGPRTRKLLLGRHVERLPDVAFGIGLVGVVARVLRVKERVPHVAVI